MEKNNISSQLKRGNTAAETEDLPQRWDYSTHDKFYEYYAGESQSAESLGRFRRIQEVILAALGRPKPVHRVLQVADIGCGAGSQSIIWAEAGHSVHALDINERLLELGRSRARQSGYSIDFRVGSATRLPWDDGSMDVCIALELLEHVADWKSCVSEFVRILRPGGVLFLTTTNRMCPVQEEFNLPLYSWYPAIIKKRCEHLATGTRPQLANYAKYPAVNWFTFYSLRAVLAKSGFRSLDRFDIMRLRQAGASARLLVSAMRYMPFLRWFGQLCTPGTRILAIRRGE